MFLLSYFTENQNKYQITVNYGDRSTQVNLDKTDTVQAAAQKILEEAVSVDWYAGKQVSASGIRRRVDFELEFSTKTDTVSFMTEKLFFSKGVFCKQDESLDKKLGLVESCTLKLVQNDKKVDSSSDSKRLKDAYICHAGKVSDVSQKILSDLFGEEWFKGDSTGVKISSLEESDQKLASIFKVKTFELTFYSSKLHLDESLKVLKEHQLQVVVEVDKNGRVVCMFESSKTTSNEELGDLFDKYRVILERRNPHVFCFFEKQKGKLCFIPSDSMGFNPGDLDGNFGRSGEDTLRYHFDKYEYESELREQFRKFEPIVNGNLGGIWFPFNSLQNRHVEATTPIGPDYLTLAKGLNFFGKCQNSSCKAFDRNVVIKKGMGKFPIGKVKYQCECPSCKKIVKNIVNMGFHDCKYQIEGYRLSPNEGLVNIQNEVQAKKLETFKDGDSAHWSYIDITTSSKEKGFFWF